MEKISFFLEKFKSLGLDSLLVKQTFVDSVKKIVGISLPVSSVELRDGTIFVTASPIVKSELFLKRTLLLDDVARILGPKVEKVR